MRSRKRHGRRHRTGRVPGSRRGGGALAGGLSSRLSSFRLRAFGGEPLARIRRLTWGQVGLAATSGAALLVGIAGFHAAAHRLAASPLFAVREIVVTGCDRLAQQELRDLAGVRPGERWLSIEPALVRDRLLTNPWVEAIRIGRPWPGRVVLAVTESRPIARVVVAGREYGLCEDLRLVPRLPEDAGQLPLIQGPIREDVLTRGVEYALAAHRCGIALAERIELVVPPGHEDRISLPDRGFSAEVEEELTPASAIENVSSFLETLDETGASRGTLRLISKETAVWEAAA